ncbi:MAG: CdaR family protein [Chloroflexota bacterium]
MTINRKNLLDNVLWFAGSLVIAIIVWFIATIEADPIEQASYRNVPISVLIDDGMIITDQVRQSATVVVRAQQSVLDILELDDITVQVDLRGQTAGTYTQPLDVNITRSATADTRPVQITVTIEQEIARQVPVEVEVTPPPVTFTDDPPERDIFQAEVSGAPSAVNSVSQVVARVDLSAQQVEATVEQTVTLIALTAEGTLVSNVTIDPASIVVSVDVSQRDDVSILTIRPDILYTTLPDNFVFDDIDYEPTTVIINAPPDVLASIGDTIDTEPISLEGRTDDFTVTVGLDLPDEEGLLVLSETSTVEVEIFIEEDTSTLPLENVPVNIIGIPEDSDLSVTVNPLTLSVFLTGPASIVDALDSEDVVAIVDVSSLEPDTYTLTPQISISQGQVSLPASDITLLPSQVTVTISDPQPEATQTPEATPESTETESGN